MEKTGHIAVFTVVFAFFLAFKHIDCIASLYYLQKDKLHE